MEGKELITYKDLYELVDKKTETLNIKIDNMQVQLASMQGQARMVPFLISTSLGIFFTIINFVITLSKK